MKASAVVGAALLALAGPVHAQSVVLVRHAEKAAEPAADPPLTDQGEARARALAQALANAGVQLVLTSPLRRTVDTAAPLVAATGIASRPVPLDGGVPAHAAAVADAARKAPRNATVVIVGHSNTLPVIARALGFAAARDIPDCRYDDLLILQLGEGRAAAVEARYGAPSSC